MAEFQPTEIRYFLIIIHGEKIYRPGVEINNVLQNKLLLEGGLNSAAWRSAHKPFGSASNANKECKGSCSFLSFCREKKVFWFLPELLTGWVKKEGYSSGSVLGFHLPLHQFL